MSHRLGLTGLIPEPIAGLFNYLCARDYCAIPAFFYGVLQQNLSIFRHVFPLRFFRFCIRNHNAASMTDFIEIEAISNWLLKKVILSFFCCRPST